MSSRFDQVLLAITVVLLIAGSYYGLVIAPPEEFMGEVYRILYLHVPSAWTTFIAYCTAFIAGIVFLFRQSFKADALAEASVEVGLCFNAAALVTGSIWAKPTWGVYWTWDPRLTTFAILFFAYVSYLALRRFVDDVDRRATWSAIAGIIIAVDIPLVWFSVKWWATLHQLQSNPQTIPNTDMKIALRLSAFAFLGVYILFTRLRYRLARAEQAQALTEPPTATSPAPEAS